MRLSTLLLAGLTLPGVGCADVADPLPPPEAVIVVSDSAAAAVGVLPTADPSAGDAVPITVPLAAPSAIATRGRLAAVPLGGADGVALVDLGARSVLSVLAMPAGSSPAGAAWGSDSLLYVSLPGLGRVLRVDIVRGDTVTAARATDPRGLLFTRGRLFILDANTVACPTMPDRCALGASRVIAIDPAIGVVPHPPDTIPLPGALNVASGAIGDDGLLYVVASGDPTTPAGRLVVVDPVQREEVANYGGLGNRPSGAGAGTGRVLIASRLEGLLEFSTTERRLTRAAGNGVPVLGAVAVAVDPEGRVYVAREEACGIEPGRLTILSPEYALIRELALPSCPSAAVLALIPAAD